MTRLCCVDDALYADGGVVVRDNGSGLVRLHALDGSRYFRGLPDAPSVVALDVDQADELARHLLAWSDRERERRRRLGRRA